MITSTTNQRIKRLVAMANKPKLRREENVFLVEGTKMFLEAPRSWVQEVYVSESYMKKCPFLQELKQIGYEAVSDEVFQKISDTKTPQGILSVLKQPQYTLEDLMQKEMPLLILLEDIQDPGNLGTIFRTAEGAGVDGIIMSRETADIFNPKATRSTMGSIYRVPHLYTADMTGMIEDLKAKKIAVYAAHLQDSRFYDEADYRTAVAFLVGNEAKGLKQQTADAASAYIKIPMQGQVESLNAAIATSLLVYEAARQRRH